jgi:hypothetical protein
MGSHLPRNHWSEETGQSTAKGFSRLNTFLIDLDWPNQANDRKSLIFNDIFSDMDASQMQVGCKGVPAPRFRWFNLQPWPRHFTLAFVHAWPAAIAANGRRQTPAHRRCRTLQWPKPPAIRLQLQQRAARRATLQTATVRGQL